MNKRNLQSELEKIINENQKNEVRPRLLLHVCCGPCSSYCLEYLNKYFDITEYYANSNIDDTEEYEYRREEAFRLSREMKLDYPVDFVEGVYDPDNYHLLVRGHENDPEGGARCSICFEMRLDEAAQYAAENGFDYFTTSLSISPLKNAQLLCDIGEKVGAKYGIKYLPSDFKKKDGYKRSIELSAEYNLYRQDYCGCSYSKSNKEK